MTDSNKQNLRFAKADSKLHKITYKGLTPEQKRYIKAREKYKQFDKELSRFWRNCKRTENGQCDFEHMSEQELDYFDYIYKGAEKARKQMEKLSEIVDVESTESIFMQMNVHSYSF